MEKRFSFSNFAKIVVKRHLKKRSDTFVIIYGKPRTGKSTLGFRLLIPYLKLTRKLYNKGLVDWNPEKRWSDLFKRYFASDSAEMNKKLMKNPRQSFVFVDEGLDVVSWLHMLEREQKELLELIHKTGEKGIFTILITPSLKLLTKPILARAHYLFIIPKEPDINSNSNITFVFRNYENPILAENMPFGLKKITDIVLKNPTIGEKHFLNILLSRDRLVAIKKFKPINKKLYDLYVKLVKEPSLIKRKQRAYVPFNRYFKIRYALMTLIYNLKFRDGKSVSQIHRLLTDKFGVSLLSMPTLSSWINKVLSIEKKPDINMLVDDEFKFGQENIEYEDLDVDESISEIEND